MAGKEYKLNTKKTVLALGLILLSATGLYGCGGAGEPTRLTAEANIPELPEPAGETDSPEPASGNAESAVTELTASADTREEAEVIAALYEIELKSYSYGIATYTTDKNAQELMKLGEENDYPALTPNYEVNLYTDS